MFAEELTAALQQAQPLPAGGIVRNGAGCGKPHSYSSTSLSQQAVQEGMGQGRWLWGAQTLQSQLSSAGHTVGTLANKVSMRKLPSNPSLSQQEAL